MVAEAIQTILRREGYPNPYEALKDLPVPMRKLPKHLIAAFIDTLDVSETIKEELKGISPSSYTGIYMVPILIEKALTHNDKRFFLA